MSAFAHKAAIYVLTLFMPVLAFAADAPLISDVLPIIRTHASKSPVLILGEGFNPGKSEVRIWAPPKDEKQVREVMLSAGGEGPPVELPPEPPPDALKVKMLGGDRQTLIVNLPMAISGNPPAVMWAEADGLWSAPRTFNLPQPLWLSDVEVVPGAIVYAYGFFMNIRFNKTLVALKSGQTTNFIEVKFDPLSDTDYQNLLSFAIPTDLADGNYRVFIHNGVGGVCGWAAGGEIRVSNVAPDPWRAAASVRKHGAVGDGRHDDTAAIDAAIKAAGRGGIVHFPPGHYAITRTLLVPDETLLRGSGAENTKLLGIPKPGTDVRQALLCVNEGVAIHDLSLGGSVTSGTGGDAAIVALASSGATQRLRVNASHLNVDNQYRAAFVTQSRCSDVRFTGCRIYGNVDFGEQMASRVGFTHNFVLGGTLRGSFSDSLFESNVFRDLPGPLQVLASRSLFRLNEFHGENLPVYFRGQAQNPLPIVGKVASATASTFKPALQTQPSVLPAGAVVVIVDGRGRGQFRRIVGKDGEFYRIDVPWEVVPDSKSGFFAGPLNVENTFDTNFNNTGGAFLLEDSIKGVVARTRDMRGGGLRVSASESSLCWLNLALENWLDLSGIAFESPKPRQGFPAFFGNIISSNAVRQPPATGIVLGSPSDQNPQVSGPSFTILDKNSILHARTGIAIPTQATHTTLVNNFFLVSGQRIEGTGEFLVEINSLTPKGEELATDPE